LDQEGKTPAKNFLLSKVMKNRRLFHFILRRAYLAQKPFVGKEPMIRHLPLFFGKEHEYRSLPSIAKIPFRDQWMKLRPEVIHPKYSVALFCGCAIDFIYPEQGKALLDILKGHDVQVEFPMDQTCCGLPALMASEEETAKEVAIQNLKAMDSVKCDYILTLCASCGSHLKHNYLKIFKDDPNAPANLKQFTDKIIDFSSSVTNVLNVTAKEYKKTGEKVAYHSPCHLCRGLGVTDEPRKLIEIAGYEYVPSKDEDVCCGFGGSYSIDFPEISSEILKKKLDNVEKTDARILVTDCPGCVLQLRGGMDNRRSKIQVKHIAEIISEVKK
jgi:Fe-S oxidoreductase